MRRLEPGEVAAWSLIGAGLTASVVLVRVGRDPVSSCVRRSLPLRVVVAYGAAHLLLTLRWDPLTLAGARLAKRAVEAVTP